MHCLLMPQKEQIVNKESQLAPAHNRHREEVNHYQIRKAMEEMVATITEITLHVVDTLCIIL